MRLDKELRLDCIEVLAKSVATVNMFEEMASRVGGNGLSKTLSSLQAEQAEVIKKLTEVIK